MCHGTDDDFLGLAGGTSRHTVREVFHHIEPTRIADRAKAGDVVAGVEQVLTVRRREHEVRRCGGGADIDGDIFAGTVQQQTAGSRQAMREGGLGAELVRKLPFFGHQVGVGARGCGQARITF